MNERCYEAVTDTDVIIIGGGIAGSALGYALASFGIETTILERQTVHQDRVRGEVINCWGVREAQELKVLEILEAAGGNYADRFVAYDETVTPEHADAVALDVGSMLEGIPGVLDVGHPEACSALLAAAESAGAAVIRGVTDTEASAGAAPRVRFKARGRELLRTARLIVGADGRVSATRRQLGIELTQTPANSLGGGLLADGIEGWRQDTSGIGTEDDLLYFVYPRANGRARLYLLHSPHQKGRFSGATAAADFLSAFRFRCIPDSAAIFGNARPALPNTPCAFFPMNDSWCDTITRPGAVLIGDAAGWSDPVVGQGLSIALRDARLVRDALLGHSRWTEDIFRDYVAEREVRMQRLLLSGKVRTAMGLTFGEFGRRRRAAYARAWPKDELLAGSRLATFKGPHNVPAESFEPHVIDRILRLGQPSE
ncbi:FAD-dependent oxidoreductase [Nocardia sp. NPDC003482]